MNCDCDHIVQATFEPLPSVSDGMLQIINSNVMVIKLILITNYDKPSKQSNLWCMWQNQ